jgi:hypothetical protein
MDAAVQASSEPVAGPRAATMRNSLVVAGVALVSACQGGPQPLPAEEAELEKLVRQQQGVVEAFFGAPLPRAFALRTFAHKAGIAQLAQQKWQVPELPCWAVAMGTGSTLAILLPSAWRAEACEHDPDDKVALARLIAHELVHVYHGQHRSDPEFFAADDVAWFVEGLAVHASGQLDDKRERQAAQLVAAGKAPQKLADAWTGPARYAVAGTLVRHVDRRLGRAGVVALFSASTTAAILTALGTSEAGLLADWQEELAAVALRR